MRKTLFALSLAVAAVLPLAAQNINQSVSVTNDYIARFADFQKQQTGMQVPDTLYRFAYDFDYSVFDTPYRGSYDFSPYRIELTPEPMTPDSKRLYLRAGAGYSLHPQFELAWQALRADDLSVGVYADIDGYAGRYGRRGADGNFGGHDIRSRAGLNGLLLRPRSRLSYQFGYEGIYSGEAGNAPLFRSAFQSALASARIRSREYAGAVLRYDVRADYRHSGDSYTLPARTGHIGENVLLFGFSAGPVVRQKYGFLMDADLGMQNISSANELLGGTGTNFYASLRPHLDFVLGPVHLDAGLRLDYAGPAGAFRFSLSPDVTARMDIPQMDLELYAGISGGQSLRTFYDLKQINHTAQLTAAQAGISREQLHILAGLTGRWNSRLQYSLETGYVSYLGQPLASLCGIVLTDYKSAYGLGRLSWKGERLDLDGIVSYSYLRIYQGTGAYAPPAVTATLQGSYNWLRQLRFGAFLDFASSRILITGDGVKIPAYANVGLTGAWQIDAHWGLWAEAGNLLGMAIERMPGFVEKSPYLTLGLSFGM